MLENAVPLFGLGFKNGVMILDHYNNPTSPSESYVIDSVGNNSIEKIQFSDHPSAFIIKKINARQNRNIRLHLRDGSYVNNFQFKK